MTKALLKRVKSWQRAIVSRLDSADGAAKNRVARSLILQVLALYLCEQRGIIATGQLQALQQKDSVFSHLIRLWQSTQIPLNLFQEFELANRLSDCILSQLISRLYECRLDLSIALLGQVYEALLEENSLEPASYTQKPGTQKPGTQKPGDRKSGGVYYTPEAIVSYVLQMTLGKSLHSAESSAESSVKSGATTLTLLDPSCGCGAFLLSAYQFLLDWYLQIYGSEIEDSGSDYSLLLESNFIGSGFIELGQNGKWHLTRSERERLLLTQIYGVDLDPQAVEITKLGLYLLLLEGSPDRSPLPDLNRNIQCGNALASTGYINGSDSGQIPDRPFDWHQAFPEILRSGGFDLVIGNPPYLDSEGMTAHLPNLRRYCAANYQAATGNWDLFCVFIEKALTLCKPGGFTSLVVPNKLASANYAAGARSLLVQQTSLLTIRDYSSVSAFRAAVYPLVYVAQKLEDQSAVHQTAIPIKSIAYERMQSLEQIGATGKLSLNNATQPWQTSGLGQQDWIDRLQFPTLGEIAQVTGAATVAEAYALQPWIQNSDAIAPGDLRLVNSGTIDRYCFLWGKKPLRYLGKVYRHPILAASQVSQLSPPRKQQAQQPKIIVAGLSQVLESGLDQVGSILAGKSTSVIRTMQAVPLDLRYLLGLLNSRLLSVYFQSCFAGNCLHGGYLRIGTPQLRQLPIWIPNLADISDRQNYDQLIDWVNDRLLQDQFHGCESSNPVKIQVEIDRLDHLIDHHVYKLYQLKDAEIDRLLLSPKTVQTHL